VTPGQTGAHSPSGLLISCVNGLAISYAGIRLQHMVASTSFMAVTNVNKFAVILFGILTLGESVRACSRRSIARAHTLLGVSSHTHTRSPRE
jgi:hypothetical protein